MVFWASAYAEQGQFRDLVHRAALSQQPDRVELPRWDSILASGVALFQGFNRQMIGNMRHALLLRIMASQSNPPGFPQESQKSTSQSAGKRIVPTSCVLAPARERPRL